MIHAITLSFLSSASSKTSIPLPMSADASSSGLPSDDFYDVEDFVWVSVFFFICSPRIFPTLFFRYLGYVRMEKERGGFELKPGIG